MFTPVSDSLGVTGELFWSEVFPVAHSLNPPSGGAGGGDTGTGGSAGRAERGDHGRNGGNGKNTDTHDRSFPMCNRCGCGREFKKCAKGTPLADDMKVSLTTAVPERCDATGFVKFAGKIGDYEWGW